jgi:hypothetical protein
MDISWESRQMATFEGRAFCWTAELGAPDQRLFAAGPAVPPYLQTQTAFALCACGAE